MEDHFILIINFPFVIHCPWILICLLHNKVSAVTEYFVSFIYSTFYAMDSPMNETD